LSLHESGHRHFVWNNIYQHQHSLITNHQRAAESKPTDELLSVFSAYLRTMCLWSFPVLPLTCQRDLPYFSLSISAEKQGSETREMKEGQGEEKVRGKEEEDKVITSRQAR
jgi:hypothetical protein